MPSLLGDDLGIGHLLGALAVGVGFAFASYIEGEHAAAFGCELAGKSLGHKGDEAVVVGVGEKPQAAEVHGQDGHLAVVQQMHRVQHGAIAAEHDGHVEHLG